MCSSLLSNVNSEEFEKENLLTNRPNLVHVIVEDEGDCRFWNDLLRYSMPNKDFEVYPYQFGVDGSISLVKGKDHLLKDTSVYGKFYIACVDSDYDYLLDEVSPYHQALLCPYVIQTQAYSFENYVCTPSTLNDVCFRATVNNTDYGFTAFFEKLSGMLYSVLIWSLYMQSIGEVDAFKIDDDWRAILSCSEGINKISEQELLERVEELVRQKIDKLKQAFPNAQSDVDACAERLCTQFGLNPSNAYMYVQGHALFSFVLNVLIKPLCNKMRNEHIDRIKKSCQDKSQNDNLINHYRKKSCRDCEESLLDNFGYKTFHPFVPNIVNRVRDAIA